MQSHSSFQTILLAVALAVPAWSLADSVPPHLNLDWVLARVRQNNPEIKAARAEVDMAKSMVTSARAWPDPQIGVEFWNVPRPGFDLSASDQRWLDISQEIPFPTKTYLQSEVAEHGSRLKEAEAEKTVQEQVFMAKQAYWDFYTASMSMKAVSKTARALGQLVEISERRNRMGQVGRMEQLMDPMAKMEKVGLENQALGLAQERVAAQAKLKRLMGAEFRVDLPDPGEEQALENVEIQGQDVMKRAMENRPDIVEARHHLLHTQAQHSLAASGWMPDFMLQYSLVDNVNGPQSSMGMAKVNLPFIWFWRQGAEVSAASKEVEASQAMLQSVNNETWEMVVSEVAMFRTSRAQLENDKSESLPNADKVLKLGVSGYKAGSVGVSDALGAVKSYLMANLEALALQAQIGRSVAVLEQLVGGSLSSQNHMEMP